MDLTARRLALGLGVLLALLVTACLSIPRLHQGVTDDSDTLMRLSFLQWELPRGHLTDYAFPRDGAPYGMVLHWTVPYDLFLTILSVVPAIWVGWHQALAASALVSGPLMMLAQCAACLSLGRALGLRRASAWIIASLSITPMLLIYAEVGRADHHPMTVACATMALSAAIQMCREPYRRASGIWAAVWFVLAAWTSMEAIAALVAAWSVILAGAALRRHQHASRAFAVSLVVLSIGALALDPPPDGLWVIRLDRWSLFHVMVFLVLAGSVAIAPAVRGRGSMVARVLRSACPAVILALPLAFIAWRAAQDFLPDPLVHAYFLQGIGESQHAWISWDFLFIAGWPTLPALAILAGYIWRGRARPRFGPGILALLILIGEIGIGLMYIRLMPYAASLSVVVLGASVYAALSRDAANSPITADQFLCGLLMAAVLGVGYQAIRLDRAGYIPSQGCVVERPMIVQMEEDLPPGSVIFSDVWMSPKILWMTGFRTVAGPYHTNLAGLSDLAHVFTGTSEKSIRAILARRQAAAILICAAPSWSRQPLFGPRTFARRLTTGHAPQWLRPVPVPDDPGIKLFLIESATTKR